MTGLVRAILGGSLLASSLAVSQVSIAADWARYYGGLSLSSQSAKAGWQTTGLQSAPFPAFPIATNPNENLGPSGARYGIYGGKNWQIAERWFAGIDASVGSGSKGRTLSATPGYGFPSQSDSISVTSKWNSSLDARAGYAVTPDVLAFGIVGYSWQRFDGNYVCPANLTSWCLFPHDESKSWTRSGLEYGVGAEWAFAARWTARADYRFANLGSTTDAWFPGAPVPGLDTVSSKINFKTQTLNLGVGYQF